MNTPQSYRDAYEYSQKGNSSELGKAFILFIILMVAMLLASCSKEELVQPKQNASGAISVQGDSVSPNGGSFPAPYPIMTFMTGAEFNLTYYNGDCNLLLINCGPQGAVLSSLADTANGNFIIHQGNPETFTVSSTHGSMQFEVMNINDTIAMITFVSTGAATITTPALAIGNNVYLILANQNRQFILAQERPWLGTATPSPNYNQ